MKQIIIKSALLFFCLFSMQMRVFSNEKSGEPGIKGNSAEIKLNFNTSADVKDGGNEDEILKNNLTKAQGYLALEISGLLIALVAAPGAFVGILFAFGVFGGNSGFTSGIGATVGGIFLGLLAAIALITGGVLMAVAGYKFYNKYRKSKQPDPFIEYNKNNETLSMGVRVKI